MARQPLEAGGDYAMVGDSSEDGAGITIDDRSDADIVRGGDEWDDLGDKDKKPPVREKTNGSIFGGRDVEEQDGDRSRTEEGNEDDAEEDARLAYSDPDDDVPQERASRRRRRNRGRRTAITSRELEIEDLRAKVAKSEQIISGIAGGQFMSAAREIEQRIASANSALELAGAELARAIKDGDGDAWEKIDKARSAAQQELWNLQQQKAQVEARVRDVFDEKGNLKTAEPQQQGIDPRLKRQADFYSEKFQERFPWFDPNGRTAHDRAVREIDREIFMEGETKPHDADYWREMEARMREAGYRPGSDRPSTGNRDETYEEERPGRREARDERSPNRPPTAAARPSRPGNDRQGARLSATESDALRQLGLLEEPGEAPIRLSKEETQKRDNIVEKWMAAKKRR